MTEVAVSARSGSVRPDLSRSAWSREKVLEEGIRVGFRQSKANWGQPALGVLIAIVFFAIGCGKTMSDEDCQHVADHMLEVWNTEANKALSEGNASPPSDRGQAVIRAEGQKLVGEWISECKQELKGRRVDPEEIDCLMAAKTVDAISNCARASQ